MKTFDLSEPLKGATAAMVEINSDIGNLSVDSLAGDAQLLASGTLEYLESQRPPTPTLTARNGQATLTLKGYGTGRPSFRLPWAACNGATDWRIHLNPAVVSDVVARSGGGNVTVDLTGMTVTHVKAATGGGNMDVVLPEAASDLNVEATSGAGNVVVHVPKSVALKVHASTGFGKVIVDSRFGQIDRGTYESPDYGHAANRVQLTVKSGAGNVVVETK